MSALVMVNSSYQLMCAIEYLLKYSSLDNAMFVCELEPDSSSYLQMCRLLQDFEIEQLDIVDVIYTGSLENRIGSYGKYFKDKIQGKNFQNVLIGDIRHQWMQDFACSATSQTTMMVDDGGAVLAVINYILKPQNCLLPTFTNNTAVESRRLLAIQLKQQYGMFIVNRKIEVFSVFYKETLPDIKRNDFSKVIEFYNPQHQFVTLNEMHIIGAPLVEHNLLSLEQYMSHIERFSELDFPNVQKVYFAHRFETDQVKLSRLEKLGYQIRFSDINYETGLIRCGHKPVMVGSILSTSLFNVKAIFAEQIEAFYVRLSDGIIEQYKDKYWMIEHYTLAQHWQQIFEKFQIYDVYPITTV